MTDPIDRFGELLEQARQSVAEPTAMALATADAQGRPSVRMVLLKGYDRRGFVFFTNLESRKAEELRHNPHAALCLFWQPLEVQVRVEGPISPVDEAEADEYFASRARESQIGAWASRQSRPLPERGVLEARVRETRDRFADAPVPRPPFWSGFRIAPERIELWFGRPSRLHDRELYTRTADGTWEMEKLYP